MHSTELNSEVFDVFSQHFSSLVEYSRETYFAQVGFSAYESSRILIGSFHWNWKKCYLSAKRNYEIVFLQDLDFKTKVNPFSTDALIFGYQDNEIRGEVELFHMQNEKKSNLGAIGKADINLPWVDIRHTSGVYNLDSDNSSKQPIDMFSHTALIYSPNIWFWKSARYQPFIGVESFFIKHSGVLGIDLMVPSIYTSQAMGSYSSFLVNMEYGLLVNQFKLSYRWVKFNMLGNTENNSINPDSYSILPIRHLEVVWQFWN